MECKGIKLYVKERANSKMFNEIEEETELMYVLK